MRYLFVILVGTGIIFQSFSKLIILANFQLNKEYISKNLCVKKAVKNNDCKGQCHLKKQLQKEERSEHFPANSLKAIKEVQIICQNFIPFRFHSGLILVTNFAPLNNLLILPHPFSVFHPPQVLI